MNLPVRRELPHGIDRAIERHQDRCGPCANLRSKRETLGVQFLSQIPNRTCPGGRERGQRSSRRPRDVLNPLQFRGIFQPVGNDFDGAVIKPLEGAADGHHFIGGCISAGHDATCLVDVTVKT